MIPVRCERCGQLSDPDDGLHGSFRKDLQCLTGSPWKYWRKSMRGGYLDMWYAKGVVSISRAGGSLPFDTADSGVTRLSVRDGDPSDHKGWVVVKDYSEPDSVAAYTRLLNDIAKFLRGRRVQRAVKAAAA